MAKQYGALLVGAGGMGKAWAKNLTAHADRVKVLGWVDIREGAAAQAADEHELNGIHTGSDFGKALAETRPDFVVDVTIPEAHRDVTLQALAAGVPVLGEKPMAHSMDAAREMVAAAEKAGLLYMVSQSRRYDPRLHALRQLIEDRVGPPGILNSDFYLGPHFGGFREEMESVLLLDMAIHTLDAARFLCGATADPVSVYCDEFNPPWSWYKGAASAVAIYEMTGGLRYTYRGSWCAEGRMTSWEAEWRAVGPNGTATWDGTGAAPVADVVTERGGFFPGCQTFPADVDETMPRGIAGSLLDFLNALETGSTPMGECHDNVKSLAMVFAAIESSRAGQRVRVEF
ncbi:MAG TPA: Gfo/Idh/MocA family oxidoreductase [Armatimonadaceae bacterium]|nr:Gfo/Idh/MocA family oxidoreductase [Armatimonadaceae bacterium]